MAKKVFLAGASGVIGQVLSRMLVQEGWSVVGTTRSPEKAALLRELSIEPVVLDVFDENAVRSAVQAAKPEIVIHQLTDLPDGLDPAKMAEGRERNARIRDVGTRNLVAAAVAAGAKRLVAQSIAFAYAAGKPPYREMDPLDSSAKGVMSLEQQVLSAPLEGIVLRFGKFYGPGTGFDRAPSEGPLHVEAAANATRLAVIHGKPGIYNFAEDDGAIDSNKAKSELGWSANARLPPR